MLMDGRSIAVVSMEAQAQAVLDGLTAQNRLGGYLAIQSERAPTEVPGEMVTTFLLVTWQDRTDAKPQPEVQAPIPGQTTVDEQLATAAEPLEPPDPSTEPDGFDYSKLEAEDVEEPQTSR
jgi:hypothetical protein